jgi:hypothetical protein
MRDLQTPARRKAFRRQLPAYLHGGRARRDDQQLRCAGIGRK